MLVLHSILEVTILVLVEFLDTLLSYLFFILF